MVLLVVAHDHVNGPAELFSLGFVVNFLNGDFVFLAPGHANPVIIEMKNMTHYMLVIN